MADEIDRLNQTARKSTINYLRARSLIHLEAAIGSMLDTHSIPQVKEILRAQAEHLEQFG